MATVWLIDGRMLANVRLTDIEQVGEEGARRAIAHVDGQPYPVYNSIVDGFDPVWYEQMSLEMHKTLGKTGFVEGSATILSECPICTKNQLHQRPDAKMVECPDCERMVCEDCMTEVKEFTPTTGRPNTEPLVHGIVTLCLECAGV